MRPMGTKTKKLADPSKRVGDGNPRQEVERLIEKGRLKDAVKQAKLCWRAEATPENHRLLERAYLLRADQLRRGAMPTAAQEVAGHLLEFGVTDPTLLREAVQLLLLLGMNREAQALNGQIDSPEVRERFAHQEADLAVVDPERGGSASAEIREGGQVIRMAIEAVQKGDEAKGLAALREISRGSPFADWKLFVRGLAAHARREESEVRANWDRLVPDRAAARIARTLQALAGSSSGGVDGGAKVAVKTDALERRVLGTAVLEPLEQLRKLVASGRLNDAISRMSALRQPLAKIDPALAVRLTSVLYDPVVKAARELGYREAMTLAMEFTRAAERLPIDPHWNRLWALLWEGPQGSPDEAEGYWRKYLGDLKNLPILRAEERALAQALVLNYLGERHAREIDDSPDSFQELDRGRSGKNKVDEDLTRATKLFEESLALAPEHRPTYRCLMEAYDVSRKPDHAAAVARRLLVKFPDDLDALMFLASRHFDRDEPDQALEYARRARAIKPLDENAAELEWSIHIMRARHLALKERWEDARAEFAEAERQKPQSRQLLHVRARRAILELKASQAETAQDLIHQAQKDLPDPAPLWLALLIESIRYNLPRHERDRFEAHWIIALAGKVRGETAGAMADLMTAFVESKIDYPGRADHIKRIVGYLGRTNRTKYAHDDLEDVCFLLSLLPDQALCLEKMVKRGIKLFPDSPLFLTRAGALEFTKMKVGKGNPRTAIAHLKKARQIAEASNTPENARLLPKIREILSMLEDMSPGMPGFPFPGFGGGPFSGSGSRGLEDFFEFLGEMIGGDPFDEDDDDFIDDEPGPRPPPRKTGFGRKAPAKARKGKSR